MRTPRKYFAGVDRLKGIVLFALLTIPTTLYSQEPVENTKVVNAVYIESEISIDGSLTEPPGQQRSPPPALLKETRPRENPPRNGPR